MVNNVVLVGRIANDFKLANTANGNSYVRFTLAVRRRTANNQTDFISCVAWNQPATFMSTYLKKGALISVEGRIETGSYQNQQGQTVYTTTVVANQVSSLSGREDGTPSNGSNQIPPNNGAELSNVGLDITPVGKADNEENSVDIDDIFDFKRKD